MQWEVVEHWNYSFSLVWISSPKLNLHHATTVDSLGSFQIALGCMTVLYWLFKMLLMTVQFWQANFILKIEWLIVHWELNEHLHLMIWLMWLRVAVRRKAAMNDDGCVSTFFSDCQPVDWVFWKSLLAHLPPKTSVSTNMYCPICNTSTLTTVTKEPGLATWLTCGGLTLFGCWLGCCLIPFCIDSFKDAVHHCSKCGAVVGRKKVLCN